MRASDRKTPAENARERHYISNMLDRNGRSVVVVKKSKSRSGILPAISGHAIDTPLGAGSTGVADDEAMASVFRSWAMPEEEWQPHLPVSH